MRQGVGSTPADGTAGRNLEVWVQLGEENPSTNAALLETI